jgi:hypothetical protein
MRGKIIFAIWYVHTAQHIILASAFLQRDTHAGLVSDTRPPTYHRVQRRNGLDYLECVIPVDVGWHFIEDVEEGQACCRIHFDVNWGRRCHYLGNMFEMGRIQNLYVEDLCPLDVPDTRIVIVFVYGLLDHPPSAETHCWQQFPAPSQSQY